MHIVCIAVNSCKSILIFAYFATNQILCKRCIKNCRYNQKKVQHTFVVEKRIKRTFKRLKDETFKH